MDWASRHPGTEYFSPAVLRLGVLFWTRLHGIVSLELGGAFGDMGLDGGDRGLRARRRPAEP